MNFRITGLDPGPFRPLFDLPDDELTLCGAKRYSVDRPNAFPDRVEMRDLEVGETAILLNFTHQPNGTFYRSSHAIFVGENSGEAYSGVNVVPEVMRVRPLSLRAFDDGHTIIDADIVDGAKATILIDRLLQRPNVAYIHAHYAKRGCYAGLIERG